MMLLCDYGYVRICTDMWQSVQVKAETHDVAMKEVYGWSCQVFDQAWLLMFLFVFFFREEVERQSQADLEALQDGVIWSAILTCTQKKNMEELEWLPIPVVIYHIPVMIYYIYLCINIYVYI